MRPATDSNRPPRGRIAVNPPPAALGARHAVLWGKGAGGHHVHGFRGPLSIKTMVRGAGTWSTDEARFDLRPGAYLIVNEDQPYSLHIEPQETVETFCVFFRRGYAAEARRALVSPDETLLDPRGAATAGGFPGFANVAARDPEVLRRVADLRRSLVVAGPADPAIDDRLAALAAAMLRAGDEIRRQEARVPAARAATRAEIMRRLRRAQDAIEAGLSGPMPLEQAAAAACLSPFHFHRLFTRTIGETPGRYVRRRRLERARGRLAASDHPVVVIAHEAGFESLGSFTALFRRAYGLPPAAWRRERAGGGSGRVERAGPRSPTGPAG